ncbi:MAG TPA: TlpA disulfide reductase family protein [Gemmatimonas sp.]|uniref:TlpA family protein disulfide reductase n=1 Tax=Gemmatimonas sp. TaxID=1962908 RepID=UPI002ED87024
MMRARCLTLFTTGLIVLTAGLIVTSVAAPVAAAQTGGIAVGAMAPSFGALETLTGSSFDPASVIGKRPVVIEFWATWCPLCKKIEPQLEAARARYGERIAFLGIGVPENQTPERQQQFVTERKLSGMYLFDREHLASKAFQVPHTSYVVVLDASGKVVYTGVGGDQDIDAAIRRALPAP